MSKLTLIGTTLCPNCKIAAKKLTEAGIDFEMVYADTPEGKDIAISEKVVTAPTLIIEKDGSKEKLTNLSEIIKFIGAESDAKS